MIKDTIIKLRESKKMTQEQFGKIFNVAKSTVSMWEKGYKIPKHKYLQNICDYFSIDMDYLMGRSEITNKYKAGLKYNWDDTPPTNFKTIPLYGVGSMTEKIGDRLKFLRESKKITAEELANSINSKYKDAKFSKQSISMWENGKRELQHKNANYYCNYFNVTLDWLINGIEGISTTLPKSNMRFYEEGTDFKTIPLYSSLAAGYGYIEVDVIGEISLPGISNPQHCFAIKIESDSMEPTINNGAIVVIDREQVIETNTIGGFNYNDMSYIKRFKKLNNGTVMLVSDNISYEPIVLQLGDTLINYGKVILVVNKF